MSAEILVRAAPAGATVQDAGRPGWLHAGVPPSGPLDATAHAASNLAVGNDPRAAALEIPLGSLRIAAGGHVTVSVDGETPRALAPGDELSVEPCMRAVRYLAVAGGFDVPMVLGSRATLPVARFGGFQGRAVRPGDALPVGAHARERVSPSAAPTVSDPPDPAVIHIAPGPHVHRLPEGALPQLLAMTWRVSTRGDRVGVRLEGGAVPRRGDDRRAPAPMVRGAVQITTDGTPIVLGPDHPVTGGYPVIAVVRLASLGLLARLRPGRTLRFASEVTG